MRRQIKIKRFYALKHDIGPLRENLIRMPVGPRHHLPDLPKIPSGDVFVEKIGHGVDENYRRILPLERIAKAMRAQSDTETVWECPIGTVYRNALGIAKLAAGDI